MPTVVEGVTSPGFLDGPGARRRAGLNPVRVKVVTDLCVMEGDDTEGELTISALMPGATVGDVLANTGFTPRVADRLDVVATPSAEHLALLRDVLDPDSRYFPERLKNGRTL